MAVSKRESGMTVLLPNGEEKGLREDTTGTRVCNTCGGDATHHLFRPAIGYRCAECCEEYGTDPTRRTVSGIIVVTDGPHEGVVE